MTTLVSGRLSATIPASAKWVRWPAYAAVILLIALATVATGFSKAQATATGLTAPIWQVVPNTFLPPATSTTLLGVSCFEPTKCMAVGSWGSGDGAHTLAEQGDGSVWTIVQTDEPAAPTSNVLTAVSCTGPSMCVAVGTSSSGGTTTPISELWNGSDWSLLAVPVSGDIGATTLNDVSCVGSTCVAVGTESSTPGSSTLVERLTGGTWTEVPSPNPAVFQHAGLTGVSCPTINFCVAVGSFQPDASAQTETLIESWGGSSWVIVSSPNVLTLATSLTGVSCPTVSFCSAVGSYDGLPQTGSEQFLGVFPLNEVWTGAAWTVATSPNVENVNPQHISCTQVTFCVAVGVAIDVDFPSMPTAFIESWNGSSWLEDGTAGSALKGVNCAQTLQCVAVGTSDYEFSPGIAATIVDTYGQTRSGRVVGMSPTPISDGYRTVGADGAVAAFGASYLGSVGGLHLNAPVVGMAPTSDGNGYWTVASDGGIFTFGDAQFYGSTGSIRLNKPIVGLASTPDDHGYWLVASDGGIFSFGDARFYGSTGTLRLNKPIVGMASTQDGQGYWLVASDGGIFSFGDAAFWGSTGAIHLNQPIVGMTALPDGFGYWLVAADGGIFSFGYAQFYGSTGGLTLNQPIVGMASDSDGAGYWLVAADGGIFTFGDAKFEGSWVNASM